jgi:hypothetical protein
LILIIVVVVGAFCWNRYIGSSGCWSFVIVVGWPFAEVGILGLRAAAAAASPSLLIQLIRREFDGDLFLWIIVKSRA